MRAIIYSFILFFYANLAFASVVKGIYVTTPTMENTSKIKYFLKKAKETGINTFVVDFTRSSASYRRNIKLIKQNGIHYVARIVVFPDGGTRDQVRSYAYREKKYKLIQKAIANGAESIQLDYIRYNTRSGKSKRYVHDINSIIKSYHDRIPASIPLEVDVFGITSFGPSHHIGQDVRLFAKNVDVICPMNYPSHFQPFSVHSVRPKQTVYNALVALKSQFNNKVPVDIIAWIETTNYRYSLTSRAKQSHIAAQIRAVQDANITGWYAWSPNNKYENLFKVLNSNQVATYDGN